MALNNHKIYILALFCVLSIFATIPKSRANIGEFDEYLQEKAKQSLEESRKAFVPNPEDLTDIFNQEVGKALISENVTRRHLRQRVGRLGGCEATNPIDKCWRCDPNWAKNRKKLADCAQGFGYRVTGGKLGEIYEVTDPSDDEFDHPKPGTLRHAVIQKEPLWIIFKHHMVITLKKELICTSDKTIDGRGVEVRIAYGAGFTLQFVHNVIIHNIRIHDNVRTSGGMIRDSVEHIGIRTESDGDAINIFGSNNIWIDHVSLARGVDGLIDAVEGSTAITISNCKFNNHNDVMLLGANDATSKDELMQVTIAFNHFGKGLIQRMPRIRWGFAHIVNNDYTQWELYAIGGSAHPTILSQGNRFKASKNPYTKQVTKRDKATPDQWMKWQWRSEGDIFLNGAFFTESGSPSEHSSLTKENLIKFQPGDFVGTLTKYAGALMCKVGQPC